MKIKLTFPYPEWPITRQLPGTDLKWKGHEFFINPEKTSGINFDCWFVFNFPLQPFEEATCREGGVVLITGEPETVEPYHTDYVRQFHYVITSQRKLKHNNKYYLPQGLPWFISKSFDELKEQQPVKTKMISLICSNKTVTEGHRRRLAFVLRLKKYFQDEIDLFGRGFREFDDKWDALAPYRYSVAIENTRQPYYFTEKITDCYLTHTFPIYSGCTNITDYFSQESLLNIDIDDFETSVKKIEQLLTDPGHYSKVSEAMMTAKKQALFKYNLFAMITEFVENHMPEIQAKPLRKYKIQMLVKTKSAARRILEKFLS